TSMGFEISTSISQNWYSWSSDHSEGLSIFKPHLWTVVSIDSSSMDNPDNFSIRAVGNFSAFAAPDSTVLVILCQSLSSRDFSHSMISFLMNDMSVSGSCEPNF